MHYQGNSPYSVSALIGDSASVQTTPACPGIHSALATAARRVHDVNASLDSILQRIYGPRPLPAGTGEGKPSSEPSVMQLEASLAEAIGRLEKLAADMCGFVG